MTAVAAVAGITGEEQLTTTMAAGEARPILGVYWEETPLLEMPLCPTLTEEI